MAAIAVEIMDKLLDWQLVLQLQIREIERRHQPIHDQLTDWGWWGRGWNPDRPKLAPSGIWSLPGEYDPGLDEEAVPESPRPPINEKLAIELDTKIGDLVRFPAVWRKVLAINYVGARVRAGYYVMVPEWQRPRVARIDEDNYRVQLGQALRFLENVSSDA